jgi:hypothetical protein
MDGPNLFTTQLRHIVIETINLARDGAGTCENTFTQFCRHYTTRRSLKNWNTKIVFGLAQRFRQCWLRFPKCFCRPPQAARVCDCDQGLDMLNLQVITSGYT